MKVTQEFIASGQSDRGGWNKRQLAILGVEWPPTPGWRERSIGRELSSQQSSEFLALKGKRKGVSAT